MGRILRIRRRVSRAIVRSAKRIFLQFFRNLEHHSTYEDSAECPHLLIAEARKGRLDRAKLAEIGKLVRAEFAVHVAAS